MGKRLYIGNLSYGVTESSLRELFASVGEVTNVSIITDRETGRSKGFAFVEMGTDAQAQQAITQLNGKTVDGRPLTVAEARPQADRYGGSGGGRGDYGGGGRGGRSGGGGGGGRRRGY